MTNNKIFKFFATILTAGIYGGLGYLLYHTVQTGFLYSNTDQSYQLEGLLLCAPIAMCILWSIIRSRYIWIPSVICFFICGFFSVNIGDITTAEHLPIFIAAMAIPFLLCLYAIWIDRYPNAPAKASNASSSSTYTYTRSDYSGSSDYSSDSDSSYSGSGLSYTDKFDYINTRFSGEYSYGAMEAIDNDPTLTYEQKQEMKNFLTAFGD